MPRRKLLDDEGPIHRVDRDSSTQHQPADVLATQDQELIRAWAVRRGAEPATGEPTLSGPPTVHVQDGGAGIRFNFPGAALFRPITWDEWFDEFTANDLVFVYEEDEPGRPPSNRYRLVPKQKLEQEQTLR
jgi:hypothetical protein